MSGINYSALIDSYKALLVIFIITICIANIILIFKRMLKCGGIYSAKSLILMSLAFGDILFALFALVFQARGYFQGREFDPSCSTLKSAVVYLRFLMNFVYGVGITVLAVELIYRYKTPRQMQRDVRNIVVSFLWGAIPWFFGLIIILPLTMADTDRVTIWGVQCYWGFSTARFLAMFGVSVIFPASLAVLVCLVIMCVVLTHGHYTSQTATYQGTGQGVVIVTQNGSSMPQQYHANNVQSTYQYPTIGAAGMQQTPSAPQGTYSNYIEPQNSKTVGPEFTSPGTQYPPPNYPLQYQSQIYPAQYPPPSSQQYSTQSTVVVTPGSQANPQTTPQLPDPGPEKNLLMSIAIIHFVCTVPFAIFSMAAQGDDGVSRSIFSDADANAIAQAVLFWLSVSRSLITPIIWAAVSRN